MADKPDDAELQDELELAVTEDITGLSLRSRGASFDGTRQPRG